MPGRMILQRRLNNSDGWRTVVRFPPSEAPRVQTAAEMLSVAGDVWWRVVRDDERQQVMAVFDGRRWQAVAETEPLQDTLPWWQPGVTAATEWMRSMRKPGFEPTMPTDQKERA